MIYKQEIELLQSDPYDFLIVGGGPVGLSLAASLAYEGISICVVESGLESKDPRFDKLKYVESSGLTIKSNSRERMLGGCGQTWAGQLSNFDQCDFSDRGANYPALGIDQNEVRTLLDKFGKFFKIPVTEYFNVSKYTNSQFDLGGQFEPKVFLRQNPVFKFGDRLKHIFDRQGVDLILGWTVFNLEWEGNTCKGVIITDNKGEKKFLSAEKVVLCCGAIENIRLLQLSQRQGKISSTLPVGERFMNHPKGISCKIRLYEPVSLEDPVFQLPEKQGFTGYIGFRFTDSYVAANNLSNVYFRFLYNGNQLFNDSSWSLVKVARAFPGIIEPKVFKWFAKLIFALWTFRDGLVGVIYEILTRLIKHFGFSTRLVKVQIFAEMSSEQENCVSLLDGTNVGDSMTPLISHSLSSNDLRSIEELMEKLKEALAQKKIGKMLISKKSLPELVCNDSSHHIGGTRISLGGDDGVVSSEFKVMGSENLYVCGGSILRASGHTNPTMFFIGMALKLAKYIRGQIGLSRANKGFFELDFDAKITQPEIIIIGAGRRVREDVLPVFESLIKNHEAISIYAKNEAGIFGWQQPRPVKSLNELSASDMRKTRVIYVAVPVHEAVSVAKKLKQTVPENVKVIWDTPISEKVFHALNILKNHKKFVAEDCSYLPWLELLKNIEGATLNQILIDRGGYKYQATAIASEIQKKINGHDFLKKSNIRKSKTTLSYKMDEKLSVVIKSPRSYEEGTIKLLFDDGSEKILGGEGKKSSIQLIRNEKGQCSGFSYGRTTHALSTAETDLIGYSHIEDDIVSMMFKIKRVGLRRLILDVFNNESKLGIAEANSDARLF